MHRHPGMRAVPVGTLALAVLVLGCASGTASGTASGPAPAAALGPGIPSAAAAKQPSPPPPWSSTEPSAEPPAAGARVLEVAAAMIAEGTVVRGSCYGYVSRVFETAGYPSDRREHVFRGAIEGPYADPATIAPGDWLAIVNHPERDPMGTHSVIFVRWEDLAAGLALVVSYVGAESERPGDYTTYDVTRTYRITRATDAPP